MRNGRDEKMQLRRPAWDDGGWTRAEDWAEALNLPYTRLELRRPRQVYGPSWLFHLRPASWTVRCSSSLRLLRRSRYR